MTQRHDQTPGIDGFVLVGGASSRMGRDKAQLIIGGKKLFERAAAVLSEGPCGTVSLVGAQSERLASGSVVDAAALADLSIDGKQDSRSPLAGLYTSLVNAQTPWIAVLACDLPFVTADLLGKLASFCSDEFDAIVPIQADSRSQPLCAFYRREPCLPVAEEMLQNRDLKLQVFLSRLSTKYIEFKEIARLGGSAHFFLNMNKPVDYESALEISSGRHEPFK